jgi:hypothetical protein
MNYFLNDERRAKLIEDLTALNMPSELVMRLASYQDGVASIDSRMSALTKTWAGHADSLVQGGREDYSFMFVDGLAVTLKAYRAECDARGLDARHFPLWVKASQWADEYLQRHPAVANARAAGRQVLQ